MSGGHFTVGHCVDSDLQWLHEPGECEGARYNCDGKCCS